jgi:hypothetical protein
MKSIGNRIMPPVILQHLKKERKKTQQNMSEKCM